MKKNRGVNGIFLPPRVRISDSPLAAVNFYCQEQVLSVHFRFVQFTIYF